MTTIHSLINISPYILYCIPLLLFILTFNYNYIYINFLFLVFGIILNTILKRIIHTYRDPSYSKKCGKIDKYAMPSGHAQIYAMFSTFFILWVMLNNKNESLFIRLMVSIGIIVFLITICYQRVHLKCHRLYQVTIGTLIGIVVGIIIYVIYNNNIIN